jgi:preprotein translocase subunit SecY
MSSELARRIAFTLGALLVYRLGVYIPLPGVDLTVWTRIFDQNSSGILGQANVISGSALRSLGIFSLSITPYITVAIFLQLVALVSRRLNTLATSGERGRRTIERWTLYPALALAAVQSYGIAGALEEAPSLVATPGPVFIASTVLTLTGGTLFLSWLSGQITSRGIGNGIALIFFVGIVIDLPRTIGGMLDIGRMGILSPAASAAVLLLVVATIAFVVAMERARRLLPIRFPERQVGGRTLASQSVDLAVKLNPAGMVPAMLASWLLGYTIVFAIVSDGENSPNGIAESLSHGRPLSLVIFTALIFLFTFLYTAFVGDPTRAAENLETYGGVISDIAPGEATAEHLDGVLTRTAAIGAAYLTLLILIPDLLITYLAVPFYFGGIPLLILVCTVLDIEAQVRGHLAQARR